MQRTIPEPRLEPKDPPIIGYCAHCGGELYEGENITNIDGQSWCPDCFKNVMKPALEVVQGALDALQGVVSKWMGGQMF